VNWKLGILYTQATPISQNCDFSRLNSNTAKKTQENDVVVGTGRQKKFEFSRLNPNFGKKIEFRRR